MEQSLTLDVRDRPKGDPVSWVVAARHGYSDSRASNSATRRLGAIVL